MVLDAAGNTISKDNGKWKYEYGQAGRLLKVYKEKKWVATYLYNHLGQRTQKQTKHGITVYHYDQADHLLAETTERGSLIRAYVWLDDMPLAQIDVKGHHDDRGKDKRRNKAKEHIAYLHTDHLGTPRLATDAIQQIVWRWESDAFDAKKPEDFEDEHDGDDDHKITVNIRHSYGYADKETKLVYVWNRYLDTETGRWITSDPIGLRGGLNTFAFVRNNPLRWTDPLGLADTWEGPGDVPGVDIPYLWGPRYGNWGGAYYGAGEPTDSLDQCFMQHDQCYAKNNVAADTPSTSCNKNNCDEELRKCMGQLGSDPTRWPLPASHPFYADKYRYFADRYFRR